MVPTSTGLPSATRETISSTTALYFSRLVLYILSSLSSRMTGRLVGMTTTSSL